MPWFFSAPPAIWRTRRSFLHCRRWCREMEPMCRSSVSPSPRWTREQLIERARDSIAQVGQARKARKSTRRRSRSSPNGFNTSTATTRTRRHTRVSSRARLGGAAALLPRHPAGIVRHGRGRIASTPDAPRTRASCSKSRSVAISRRRARSTRPCIACSPSFDLSHRSLSRQGGGAESARISASPTRSWSRSGTATTSTTCRSRWPRHSASQARRVLRRSGRDS